MAVGRRSAPVPEQAIERHSIDHVPVAERHGVVWHQGPFWFTGAFVIPSMLVGFIGPGLGLAPLWSAIALGIGMALGTAFMALHANQGPRLGLPQMIQSRAQFGSLGVTFPLLVAVFIYVGYNVFQFIFSAEAISVVAPGSTDLWIVVFAVLTTAIALVGHDFLHIFQRWSSYITIVIFAILSVVVVYHFLGGNASPNVHGFSVAAFLVQITAATGYQISYAIYVSDYTRYLPEGTHPGKVIGWTFAGGFVGATWPGCLGVVIASYTTATDPVAALHSVGNVLFPGFGVIAVLGTLPALVGTSGVNSYGSMLCGATVVDGFRRIKPDLTVRAVGLVLSGAAAAIVTIVMPSDYLNSFNTFLSILVYLLIPWSAVNLVDFYLVRKGRYSIADIVDPRGRYGRWAWRGLTAYLLGFLAMLPFLSLSFYTGPVTRAIGGADISFEVGLIVAGGLYLWMSRDRERQPLPVPVREPETLGKEKR
jgi:nucleobase:cation symporter-1, NCS1 family